MRISNKFLILALAVGTTLAGCKKSVLDTQPSDAATDENLYTTTTGAYMVLDGMNRVMSDRAPALGDNDRHNDFGAKTVDLADDVMGNDVVCNANNFDWFTGWYDYTGIVRPTYAVVAIPWAFYYKVVNAANNLLARIDAAVGPEADKNNIKGQALAYRAWAYYRLSIYFCKTYSLGQSNPGLPIYLTPTSGTTEGARRSTIGEVYTQITTDLKQAVDLLAKGTTSTNKSYISLATAQGIYAKVALTMEDWNKANEMSTLAISSAGGDGKLMDSVAYLGGFNSSANSEWMWASALTADQTASFSIICFMSFVDGTSNQSYAGGGATWRKITKQLYDKIAAPDVRKKTFANDRKQTKFRLATPNVWAYDNLYMRIAEMYLIKAEALANLGQDANAISTLELLIKKRNKSYTYASGAYYTGTGNKLKEEIYLQRRIELYLEGMSYSDIQRSKKPLERPSGSGNHDIAKAQTMTLPASDNKFVWKIPQSEIDANVNMSAADQNP